MSIIRKASEADVEKLPEIERSAARVFRQIPELAWLADGDVQSVESLRVLIGQGTVWVALDASGNLIGFVSAEVTANSLHISELAVGGDQQNRGIGRALIETVRAWASDVGIHAITLTTFRHVPWNEPFYRSIGFETLERRDITPYLADIVSREADAGLPIDKRCAMVLKLA